MTAYARRARMNDGLPAFGLTGILRAAGRRLLLALSARRKLAQVRAGLLWMDDRMLKDIGITRADALQMTTHPIWITRDGVSSHWR
jgi:uncharacterized protein YjiS (DUF1127 family)